MGYRRSARRLPATDDQARAYFVDAAGRIEDEELLGADAAWSELYVDHYAGLDHGRRPPAPSTPRPARRCPPATARWRSSCSAG
jgi:hypothetical protein